MLEVVITLTLLILLVGTILWAGGGKTLHEPHGSGIIEAIPGALEASPPPSDELLVLSYTMAYGLGDAPYGRSAPATVYDRLDAVIATIAASGADIALLQEVDFASRRTHDVDQLQYIAAALGWGFVARAITWECRYLPMPWWPLWWHQGRLRAGQGVVSRYPLVQNTRQRLSQSPGQPLWSPLFAPYHTVQMVDVQCGGRMVRLLNVHLEADAAATRQHQAHELIAFVRQVATPNCVLMGILHSTTSMAAACHGKTPGRLDQSLDLITTGLRDRLRLVVDVRLTSSAEATRSPYPHALIGPGLHTVDAEVLMPDEPVSVHLPLLVRLRWALPLTPKNRSNNHASH